MKIANFIMACLVLLASSLILASDVIKYKINVSVHKSDKDRKLEDKGGRLYLDEESQRLIIENKEKPLDIAFDTIHKIVFDIHMRYKGGFLKLSRPVADYWCYIGYKLSDNNLDYHMLEIPKGKSAKVIAKMQDIFGEKVLITNVDKGEDIDKKTLMDRESKHEFKKDEINHPMPELLPDKALVVLVEKSDVPFFQTKLHVNDRVMAVTKDRCYYFFHLDPGEYRLASQSGRMKPNSLSIKMEAGKGYYFLVNEWNELSRHSKELVMHELSGADFAVWSRKE